MEQNKAKAKVSGGIEGIAIQAPAIEASSKELVYELATHALPLSSDIKKLVGRNNAASVMQKIAKRSLDFTLASVGMLALSPVLLAIAVAIKLDSQGDMFFTQIRVGKGGKLFKLHKFRTMVSNAEDLKKDLMTQNELNGPAFKMKLDPRVTRIGRLLRKTSLDELPQLWNVVCGDMSLVGPRPALPSEVAQWENWQYQRLAVEQGCTCIWQVSGRNDVDFDEWMRMDLEYVQKWSLGLDVQLIFRTILVMLTGRGAY